MVYQEFTLCDIDYEPNSVFMGRQRFLSTEACRRIHPAFPDISLRRIPVQNIFQHDLENEERIGYGF
jgi:hypothetical protein